MPIKIKFRLTHFSSEDEGFKAVELNTHCPTSKGWVSARFCSYPQVLLVKLNQPACIKKIQILSHQFLIATKISIFVGHGEENVKDNFTRLGFVELSNNTTTNYKARELKSIHVNAIGEYLKIVLHQNYQNDLNQFNQVGIIALNVIGDDLQYYRTDTSVTITNKSDYYSPLDDLAFEMYQDPAVADLIRKLESVKKESIAAEKFDEVIELKELMSNLQKLGEKIGKLEVEKEQAIENENYAKAKLNKQQIESIRTSIHQQTAVCKFLQKPISFSDITQENVLPFNEPKKLDPEINNLKAVMHHKPAIALPPINSNSNTVKTNNSFNQNEHAIDDIIYQPPAANAYIAYDERPLPPIKNPLSNNLKEEASHQLDENIKDEEVEEEEDGLDSLSENERNKAVIIQEAFGADIVSKLYSKRWSERQQALEEISDKMKLLTTSEEFIEVARLMFRAVQHVFQRTLKDIVLSVFSMNLTFYKMVLVEYIPLHKISRHEVMLFLEKSLPLIFLRTNDSSARSRELAKNFLFELSCLSEVQQVSGCVLGECLKPLKASSSPRLALAQLQIFAHMYNAFEGLKQCGASLEDVMKFLLSALCHNSGPVRVQAEQILVLLYAEVGTPMRHFFATEEDKVKKNLLHRQLLAEFDKIDSQNPAFKAKVSPNKKLSQERKVSVSNAPATNRNKYIKANIKNENKKELIQNSNRKTNVDASKPETSFIEKNFEAENQCIFCGQIDQRFDQATLDQHYVDSCPLLIICPKCLNVIEISSLTQHLLAECSFKNEFTKCSTCKEAVLKKEFSQHTKNKACIPGDTKRRRCVLCHSNVEDSEETWLQHLLHLCKPNKTRLNHHQITLDHPLESAHN